MKQQSERFSRRAFVSRAAIGAAALIVADLDSAAVRAAGRRRPGLIGYTEFRTDLPGGRHANVVTMRACVIREDGSDRRVVAESLTTEPNAWTQFAGWSPDGRTAIVGRGWEESLENAEWEEQHETFRFNDGWLYDMFLVDMRTGAPTNLTAVERVSNYNTGLFYWPNDPARLGFQALIQGESHPFSMDRDGRNKRDLTLGSREFAYGFSASPDGRRIAYHKNYQIWIADADGSHAVHIVTGQPFNFVPQWSPDGQWLLFVAGEHYDCHPYVVKADGTALRKVADRQGYRGVIEYLDVHDFHGGSSDVPVWSSDGSSIYYTAKFGDTVELMRASLTGTTERLTKSPPGTLYYHPLPSPDGSELLVGSKRKGLRQLYTMPATGGKVHAVTHLRPGWGAMWPHWNPQS